MFDLGLTLKSLSSRVAWRTRLIEATAVMRRQPLLKEAAHLVQNPPCVMRENPFVILFQCRQASA
jgi:hypothetical protein